MKFKDFVFGISFGGCRCGRRKKKAGKVFGTPQLGLQLGRAGHLSGYFFCASHIGILKKILRHKNFKFHSIQIEILIQFDSISIQLNLM